MQKISLALLICVAALAACGPPRKVVQACKNAWSARIAAVEKVTGELDELKSGTGIQRRQAADQAIAQADGRLRGLTVPAKEILLYPDQLKGHLGASRMKITGVDTRSEATGSGLRPVRYEIEAHGDYRLVPRLMQVLYSEPKAVFVDQLEVNISEDSTRRSKVIAEAHVMAVDQPPIAPGPPAEFNAAIAEAPAPLECIGVPVDKAVPERWASERAALATRRGEATQLATLVAREADAKARAELAADLARKHDDNKAAIQSHTDELIQKARASVTLDMVLKLRPDGEPYFEE